MLKVANSASACFAFQIARIVLTYARTRSANTTDKGFGFIGSGRLFLFRWRNWKISFGRAVACLAMGLEADYEFTSAHRGGEADFAAAGTDEEKRRPRARKKILSVSVPRRSLAEFFCLPDQ